MVSFPLDPAMMPLYAAVITLSGTFLLNATATLLELRRKRYQHRTELDALRRALYNEIAWTIRRLLVRFMSTLADPRVKWDEMQLILSEGLDFEVYQYTRTQPTLFYQISDALKIENWYRLMKRMRTSIKSRKGGAD
jgi:hypothetical protein